MSVSVARAPGGIASDALPLGSATVPPAAALTWTVIVPFGVPDVPDEPDELDEELSLEHATSAVTPAPARREAITRTLRIFMVISASGRPEIGRTPNGQASPRFVDRVHSTGHASARTRHPWNIGRFKRRSCQRASASVLRDSRPLGPAEQSQRATDLAVVTRPDASAVRRPRRLARSSSRPDRAESGPRHAGAECGSFASRSFDALSPCGANGKRICGTSPTRCTGVPSGSAYTSVVRRSTPACASSSTYSCAQPLPKVALPSVGPRL